MLPNLPRRDAPPIRVSLKSGQETALCASPSRIAVLVTTQATAVPNPTSLPVDWRFVLDVSGSMGDTSGISSISKLDLLKKALTTVLGQLDPKDHLEIDVFNTDGRVLVSGGAISNKRRIIKALSELEASGCTNISAGLALALKRPAKRGMIARVALLTDGHSSVPHEDDLRLIQLADRARAMAIPVSIFGTGGSYNERLLQQVAVRSGADSYCWHVLEVSTLEGHLLAELANMRNVALDEVVISCCARQGVKIVRVTDINPLLRDLTLTDDQGFKAGPRNVDFDRGNRLLVELEVLYPTAGQMPVLELFVTGKLHSTGQRVNVQMTHLAAFSHDPAKVSTTDEEIKSLFRRRVAHERAQRGEYQQAEDLLRRAGATQDADALHTMVQTSVQQGYASEETRRALSSITATFTGFDSNRRTK